MTIARIELCVAVVLAAACGKPSDVAEINALVPAAWRGKIEFAPTTMFARTSSDLHRGGGVTFAVAAPKGWSKHDGGGVDVLEPPDANESGRSPTFGTLVSMHLFANCVVEPADGRANADREQFVVYFNGDIPTAHVLENDQQPTGRVMVAEDTRTGSVAVKVATWKTEPATCYWVCDVNLARESRELVAAFEQACRGATVVSD